MLDVKLVRGTMLEFSNRGVEGSLTVHLQRTLRIPDDGRDYPLPPSLGNFPMRSVMDYADRVPESWLDKGGVFVPMYQREALWIQFQSRSWRPNAVKVGAGRINAVTGKPLTKALKPGEQDYMVCPPQPWLDGFNTGDGTIRQFVTAPLGLGLTVEGQVSGREEHGGLQLLVFEPKRGLFPATNPYKQIPRPPTSVLDTRNADEVLDRLVARGHLSPRQRERAEAFAAKWKSSPLRRAIELDWVEERVVLEQIGEMLGIQVLKAPPVEDEALRSLPEHLCRRHRCVSLGTALSVVFVAVADPLDALALDDVQLVSGFEVVPVLASEAQIDELLSRAFGDLDRLGEVEDTVKDISAQDFGPMDLGLGCGGSIQQEIYADPHGLPTWSQRKLGEVHVHLVNTAHWTAITGEPPPPTTVDALAYTQMGYPWYEVYEAEADTVAASPILAAVKPIPNLDASVGVPFKQIRRLPRLARARSRK